MQGLDEDGAIRGQLRGEGREEPAGILFQKRIVQDDGFIGAGERVRVGRGFGIIHDVIFGERIEIACGVYKRG